MPAWIIKGSIEKPIIGQRSVLINRPFATGLGRAIIIKQEENIEGSINRKRACIFIASKQNSFTNTHKKSSKRSINNPVYSFWAFLSDPVWIRTKDLQLRRLLLYPAELRDHFWERKYTPIFLFSKHYFVGASPSFKFKAGIKSLTYCQWSSSHLKPSYCPLGT